MLMKKVRNTNFVSIFLSGFVQFVDSIPVAEILSSDGSIQVSHRSSVSFSVVDE